MAHPAPKRGDVVILPSGDRLTIESVSAEMAWFTNRPVIPVCDLSPSSERDTWSYVGDTHATK